MPRKKGRAAPAADAAVDCRGSHGDRLDEKEANASVDFTLMLPDEIMIGIFLLIPTGDLWMGTQRLVCTRWSRLMRDTTVRRHCRSERWTAYAQSWIRPDIIRHRHGIGGLVVDGDGTLYTGSDDGVIRVWRPPSLHNPLYELIRQMKGHRRRTTLFSLCWDRSIRLWSTETGEAGLVIEYEASKIAEDMAVAANGTIHVGFTSFRDERCLAVYSASTGGHMRWLMGHEVNRDKCWESPSVNSVCCGADRTVVTGSFDSTIRLWSIDDGSLLRTVKREHAILSVASGPTGRIYAFESSGSGPKANTIIVFDKHLERLEADLQVSTRVRRMTIRCGQVAMACGTDVIVWDGSKAADPWILKGHKKDLWGVAIGSDGTVYSSGNDAVVRIWRTRGDVKLTHTGRAMLSSV